MALYHEAQGSVSYTVVGNPTIKDGVASGFSNSNYLNIPYSQLDLRNIVFHCKFKTGSDITTNQSILQFGNTGQVLPFLLWISGNKLTIFYAGKNTSNNIFITLNDNLSTNTDYEAEFGTVNSVRYFKFGTSGNMIDIPLTQGTDEDWNGTLSRISWIGNAGQALTTPFTGSIDLNHTYIKVNGSLWFYQPQGTKYIIRENPTTHAQHLVYAKPNMYLSGPVNYSVVGNPTIEDCNLTVFGSGNYIELPSINLFSKNSFEYVITLQIGDNYPKGILAEFPFDDAGGTSIAGGLYIWGNAGQGTMNGGISSSDTNIEAYPVLSLNTKYAFRFKKESGVFTTAWRANDGAWQQLTTDNGANKTTNSTSRPIHIGLLSAITGVRFLLNETYCMTNDTLWFYGKNYSSKNIAPVPSGFTYGTTTTNAIGWVDMRTQAFTAAPEGTGYNEVPVMPSGGIDEHTLYLWHCDSDLKDSIGGTTALKGTLNTTYHKFGEGSIKNSLSASQSTASISGFSDTADSTIDYWVYVNSNANGNNTVGFIGCCLDFRNGKIQNDSGNNKWGTSFSEDISLQTWHHVAVVYDYSHSEIRVYLDGHKIATSAINTSGYSNFGSITVWSYGPTLYVDEIRLSDTVRYTADFTVPTQPYS